jgi:hypothetical protein
MTTALTTIEEAKKKHALICLNEGDLLSREPLYKAQITEIVLELPGENETESADCWNIQGKIVPKRHAIDRMGEAAGVSYVAETCRNWAELRDDPIGGKRQVFVSEQQGKIRMPDGSWKTSSLESYEFDPVLRTLEDQKLNSINDQPLAYQAEKKGKNGSTYKGKATGQLILENNKRGRQMAETGARLRVVRELTALPTALTREQAAKPLTFVRWVQNTDYLLSTPEGRLLAAAQATGTQELVASLYGKKELPAMGGKQPEPRNVTEEDGSREQTGAGLAAEAAGDGDDWTDLKPAARVDELQDLTVKLEEYLGSYKEQLDVTLEGNNGRKVNPYELAMREFNDPQATAESRKAMLSRIEKLIHNMEKAS